jgi:hypothetical protein
MIVQQNRPFEPALTNPSVHSYESCTIERDASCYKQGKAKTIKLSSETLLPFLRAFGLLSCHFGY